MLGYWWVTDRRQLMVDWPCWAGAWSILLPHAGGPEKQIKRWNFNSPVVKASERTMQNPPELGTWWRTDWRFIVGVVTGGHFLSHFYKLAFPPLFPLLALEFGLSNVELGLLVTASGVGSFLQAPVGVLVDRYGGKRLFLVAICLTSLGVVLAGIAPTYHTILLFTLLSGLGQAAFHPADYSLLDTVTAEHRKGKSYGVHNFGSHAGSASAPVVIGGIGYVHGWRPALLATGMIGLVYVIFAAIMMDPVHRRTVDPSSHESLTNLVDLRRSLSALVQLRILTMVGFFAVFGMAIAGIKSFAPVLSIKLFELTAGTANATLSAFFVASAVSVLIGGALADRYSPLHLIIALAGIATTLTWGIVSDLVAVNPTQVVVFFVVLGLFTGLMYPARDRLVALLSGSGSTGTSFGLAFTGGTVGGTFSPVLLGAVIDAGSPRLAFVLIGGFFLSGAVLIATLGMRTARTSPKVAE